jgi:hypothetical protein
MNTSAFRLRLVLIAPLAIGPAAGGHSPSIDVLGSYFPAWMICIMTGLALTLIARQLLIALRLNAHLHPAPIIYASLVALFTMIAWLAFFQN